MSKQRLQVACISWLLLWASSAAKDKFCDNHPPLVRWLSWCKVTDGGPILSVMAQYGDPLHSQMHGTVLANVAMRGQSRYWTDWVLLWRQYPISKYFNQIWIDTPACMSNILLENLSQDFSHGDHFHSASSLSNWLSSDYIMQNPFKSLSWNCQK